MDEWTQHGCGSDTRMETEFETWTGARRAAARGGFERVRTEPGVDGCEEHYSRAFPDQNIMAMMTLTRPVAYAGVHAEIRYVDVRTGRPTRMPVDDVSDTLARLAS